MYQRTADIDTVPDDTLVVETLFESVAAVVGGNARSESSEVPRSRSRSHASEVPSSDVENADMLGFCSRIQELQAENEYIFSCQAGYQKLHMNAQLKLCPENNASVLESEVQPSTQQLVEVPAAQEMGLINRLVTLDAIATQEDAE